MNFDDLKDQIIERLQETWSKVRESEAFISLKERYDNLSPNIQKLLQVSLGVFAAYFIYSIPSSFVDSANEHEKYFAENRQLTRDLIRAGRIARTTSLPPPAPTSESLKQQVDAALTRERVITDQKRPLQPVTNVAPADLVPKSIKQEGLKIGATKLNLKQTIRVAEELSNINSTSLINMYVQADGTDPHYYSVDYEVASFSVPIQANTDDDKGAKKSKFKSKFKKRK